MKTSFADVMEKFNLPFAESARLVALAQSRTFDRLVEEEEKEVLKTRAELVARLAKLHATRYDDASYSKACQDAQKALERAHLAYQAAGAACMAASGASFSHSYGLDSAINVIEHELRERADPRLQQFMFVAGQLRNPARIGFYAQSSYELTIFGRKKFVSSNIDAVEACMDAITECVTRCRALQLSAVSRTGVTEALQQMCQELGAVLRPMGIMAPVIVDGEIRGTALGL